MTTMSIAEVRNNLAEAINKVAYAGERIVFARRGKALAALVSADDLETLQRLEEAEDLRDALKTLRDYERDPSSCAMPYEQFRRKIGLAK